MMKKTFSYAPRSPKCEMVQGECKLPFDHLDVAAAGLSARVSGEVLTVRFFSSYNGGYGYPTCNYRSVDENCTGVVIQF